MTDTVEVVVSAPGAVTGTTVDFTVETSGPGAPTVIEVPTALIPNSLTIGVITTGGVGGQADASITGAPPNQILNLTLPRGIPTVQYPVTLVSSFHQAHIFPYPPNVSLVDQSGHSVNIGVSYPDSTHIFIEFPSPFTGTIILS